MLANSSSFSQLSVSLTKQLSQNEKKTQGIYFTPNTTVTHMLSSPCIAQLKSSPTQLNILEPCCGSGQFLTQLTTEFPNSQITAVEFNKFIFDNLQSNLNLNLNGNIKCYNQDFLQFAKSNKVTYDLIIGNPPFVVVKKQSIDSSFYKYFDGRPNLFIIFIIQCLQLLSPNGILSFIVPSSFLNCLYYQKTRQYITNNFTLVNVEPVSLSNSYIDTEQPTVIITIKNQLPPPTTNLFSCNLNNCNLIFGDSQTIDKLTQLSSAITLSKLQCTVSIGNIVWNQHKLSLSNTLNSQFPITLIYSNDIKNGQLLLQPFDSSQSKQRYISSTVTATATSTAMPILVVKRGYGVGAYKLQYAIIDVNYPYALENHLICIHPPPTLTVKSAVIDLFTKIIKSFDDNRTQQFISLYCGNSALNSTELLNILPIYM